MDQQSIIYQLEETYFTCIRVETRIECIVVQKNSEIIACAGFIYARGLKILNEN